jgi:hypothetical protein
VDANFAGDDVVHSLKSGVGVAEGYRVKVLPSCALCCEFLIIALEAISFARLGAAIVVMIALSRTFVEFGFADVGVWHGCYAASWSK